MRLSCFTPLGLLELSNRKPKAQSIYETMRAPYASADFDLTVGYHQEAVLFATARSKALADVTLRKAQAQALVAKVDILMPVQEDVHGIHPAWDATFLARRAELVRRRRRPGVWTKVAIAAELSTLLGADFIAYRPTKLAEAGKWPVAIGDQPQNLQVPQVARKLIRITQAISVGLGAPQAVTYELLNTSHSPTVLGSIDLIVGDLIVVEPEILGITETVTVTAVAASPKTFTAIFNKPHTVNCIGSTAPYPKWISTKRHNLVIVTPTCAIDPVKRAVIDARMRLMVRASSTWDIVDSADGLTTGSFVIGAALIGSHTITSVTI